MTYTEEKRDLFSVPGEYYLAHCISADFGMGKGIAVEFNRRFNMRNILREKYPDQINGWRRYRYIGKCILEGRVLNLVTKERYFHKPTYESMENALLEMKSMCSCHGIKKVAMPIIGCGLDRLKWDKVSAIIQETFADTDIEILVCKQ